MSEQVAHAIAGAGGGALSAVVTYPLINLSTRAQIAAKDRTLNWEAIQEVLREGGVQKLYSGLGSALSGMTLTNFVYHYFYEGIRVVYLRRNALAALAPHLSTTQLILTGMYSGAATAIVTNPIWVVNTRTMVSDDKTTYEVIKEIVQRDGVGAFFSGVGPALLLVLNPVLNYTINERLRYILLRKRGKLTSLDIFLLGALGKIVATTVTYPLLTIKSRLQAAKPRVSGVKESLFKRLLQLWASLRFSELYRGWSLKVLQSALQSALLFLFKEQLFELALLLLKFKRLNLRLA